MTTAERLAYCDELESRALGNLAHFKASMSRRYEPNFTMPPAEYWSIPHPYEDAPPNEWDRVAAGCIGMAVTVTFFAAFVALVKT